MAQLRQAVAGMWAVVSSRRFLQIVGTLAVVAVFSWSIYNLYYEISHVQSHVERAVGHRQSDPEQVKKNLEEMWRDFRSTPMRHVLWAVALTVLSYLVLVAYDMLAMAFVNQKLPLWKVALASFIGYSFSYNFGATFSGGPIRFRLYAGWKVPLGRIVELLVILGLTFWFGLFFLGGALFTIAPPRVPPEVLGKFQHSWFISFVASHLQNRFNVVGLTLLGVALAYLGASAYFKGHIRLFGKQIPVPALRLTLYQYAIASADFIVAAAVLYSVLPPEATKDGFALVLTAYILAYVIEVVTHVPGGWGVFDYILCKLLPGDFLAKFAAVLLFRVIYRLVPVLIGAVLFAANEVALRREALLGLSRIVLHHEKKDEG